jgi:hypothetical protein
MLTHVLLYTGTPGFLSRAFFPRDVFPVRFLFLPVFPSSLFQFCTAYCVFLSVFIACCAFHFSSLAPFFQFVLFAMLYFLIWTAYCAFPFSLYFLLYLLFQFQFVLLVVPFLSVSISYCSIPCRLYSLLGLSLLFLALQFVFLLFLSLQYVWIIFPSLQI